MPAPDDAGGADGDRLAVLVGDDVEVPCVDGHGRRYVNLDAAASTGALAPVADRLHRFLPWYSSVHRGAGYKSQVATAEYEAARAAALAFSGRRGTRDVAILCRNTTEAINHLAYRLRLTPSDTVVTTVIEHHANLLPWARLSRRRFVECGADGTFCVDDVTRVLDAGERPRLLAITGASNVTGWEPPIDEIISAAHDREVQVLVDAAQLAPHRPIPAAADFVAWSGHKMYAPFGAGVLVGPRDCFADGDPFLAGGGAVDLVDLERVAWAAPPEREEAGSPNVIGAVALHAAIDHLQALGWDRIAAHDRQVAERLRRGLADIEGVRLLGPRPEVPTLPTATFNVDGIPHALVAARLSAEYAVAVRHGCFCAHPYLIRLLGLGAEEVDRYQQAVLAGDHERVPGAVRASAGINTSTADIDELLVAVSEIAAGKPAPIDYVLNPLTGDYHPADMPAFWYPIDATGSPCARG